MTGAQLRHFVDPANRVLSPHTLEHDRDCYYSIVASLERIHYAFSGGGWRCTYHAICVSPTQQALRKGRETPPVRHLFHLPNVGT